MTPDEEVAEILKSLLEAGRIKVVPPSGAAGLTDQELRSSPVPVSGTFYQATQPISGNVGVTGNVAVTGAFFQATQPVSGAFFQATQPVSLASVPSHPVTGPLTNAELRAAAVPVTMSAGGAMTFVSAKTAAPLASAVQCDTGQLPAGDYDFDISLACSDTVAVGKGLVIEHRNAANNANINVLGGVTPNGGALQIQIRKVTLALNERVRVIAGTAAGAASSMYVSAIGRRSA